MKIKLLLLLAFVLNGIVFAQYQTWEKDLVVTYKKTDAKGLLQNSITIKKDTLLYDWIEKSKAGSRILVGDTALENTLILIMKERKFLKFKSAKLLTPGPNILFIYSNTSKQKTIVMPQTIKPGSKEELFVKEFLEAIVLKVFAQELKGVPK
jgi:hypothetical protein